MEKLLLATGYLGIKEVLMQLNGYDIQTIPLGSVPRAPSAGISHLLVADAEDYAGLGEQQDVLCGYLKLLITDSANMPPDITSMRRPSVQFFCVASPDELTAAETENLVSIIRSLFAQQQMAYRLNSYISDSFQTIIDAQIVERQKYEIEKLNEELHSISRVDYLTNLLNRRAFLESLEAETKRAQRNLWRLSNTSGISVPDIPQDAPEDFDGRPNGELADHIGKLSCLIMDIDYFKAVNDTYGHLAGDMVLRKLGHMLREKGLFRENDIIGRYGGEEFIIVLPETSAEHARIPAERLRSRIKETLFTDDHQHEFSITLSIGIAESSIGEESTESLIHRADTALYYAKNHGRDQVCIYETDIPV
ncbi:MAG: GGDEF domain-containing protein [Spirochaeta sp.]